MTRLVIWSGEVDGATVRVVKTSGSDLLAEELVCRSDDSRFLSVPPGDDLSVDRDGLWAATEDDAAMHAYEAALLEAQHVLEQIRELEGTGIAYVPLGQWLKEPAKT